MATLGFEVDWFDNIANTNQKLYLKYFLNDNTIELLHYHKNSAFLKRIHYPSVTKSDLYIGNSITVYNRLLTITAYANSATEDYMVNSEVHVACTVNRDDSHLLGEILKCGRSNGLKIGRTCSTSAPIPMAGLNIIPNDFVIEFVCFSSKHAENFIAGLEGMPGVSAVTMEANMIGQIMSAAAPMDVPQNCSLCLVKPHVLTSNRAEEVVNAIINNGSLVISGIMVTHLHFDMANELFRVYRNMISNYAALLEQVCSGPSMALMVTPANNLDPDEPVVPVLRELCGPNNCELAAILRPNSIRAKLGNPGLKSNVVENGVHCTDLDDDGFMECSYFFKTMSSIRQME